MCNRTWCNHTFALYKLRPLQFGFCCLLLIRKEASKPRWKVTFARRESKENGDYPTINVNQNLINNSTAACAIFLTLLSLLGERFVVVGVNTWQKLSAWGLHKCDLTFAERKAVIIRTLCNNLSIKTIINVLLNIGKIFDWTWHSEQIYCNNKSFILFGKFTQHKFSSCCYWLLLYKAAKSKVNVSINEYANYF